MPVYQFKCENCGNVFEEIIPISEKKDTTFKCPECKELANQVFCPVPFKFNCSGNTRKKYIP